MDTKHFASKQNSKSLNMKNTEPWKIVRAIDNKAYKLEISQQMKDAGLTSIFHQWKLHLASNSLFPGQILELGLLIIISSSNGKAHNK